jgi:hypothetical protein
MASNTPEISIDKIYACTGKPDPETINTLYQSLLKDSYVDALTRNLLYF